MEKQTSINFTKATLSSLPIPSKGKRSYYYDSKTRGLTISITSSGTKTFLVYRWVNSKPERIMLGRFPELSIEQARGKAAAVNASIAKGENPNDKRRADRAEMTLGNLFNEYLERHAKAHKKAWREDEAQFNRYLFSWQQRKLSTVRKTDVQKLHHEIGQTKGIYAANRLLALLSVLFNKAIEFGLWDKTNPTQGIKKYKEQTRDRFLQADELPRFFQALAEEKDELIRDYVLLSLLTGARRSNVLAMCWEELHLQRSEWHVPETKNGTPQVITLSDEAIAILEQRKIATNSPYVFPSKSKSGHLVEPKKGWQRILACAELKDLRIHDLRRTLGSWPAKTGASLLIIGKTLNHKSPTATAIYARLDLDPVRESMTKATQAILHAAGIAPVTKNSPSEKAV